MMKQAAQLQSKMQEMQAELDRIEVEGTAGGGMVTVTLSAKGELKGVKIDDSLVKPDEKEILEDLLVAAHADARRKAEDGDAGQDEGPDRRPAAAAGDEVVLTGCLTHAAIAFAKRLDAGQSDHALARDANRSCPNPSPDPRSSA